MTKKELWPRIKAHHFNHIVPAGLLSHIAAVFGGDTTGSDSGGDAGCGGSLLE